MLFRSHWGTAFDDFCYSATIDSDGNVYITGDTSGNLEGNINSGGRDAFLTKFSKDGLNAWTKSFGTDLDDGGHSIVVDNNGLIYISGVTKGTFENNINAGDYDIFFTKCQSE